MFIQCFSRFEYKLYNLPYICCITVTIYLFDGQILLTSSNKNKYMMANLYVCMLH